MLYALWYSVQITLNNLVMDIIMCHPIIEHVSNVASTLGVVVRSCEVDNSVKYYLHSLLAAAKI